MRLKGERCERTGCNTQIEPQQIADALLAMGYTYVDKVYQLQIGSRITMPALGKPSTNRSASVYLYPDGQGAYMRDWTTGEERPIWPESRAQISKAEAARLFRNTETMRRKAEADKQVLQDRIARQAQDQHRAGLSTGSHPYITRKQLSGLHNARIESKTGALLIPMWLPGVGLVNLQQIFADGTKRFLKGARVKGAYSVIGSLNNAERVLVCEGWATGASLFELHGLPVVVTFNAGNLIAVCQALRSRFENLAVVVAGDDDRQNAVNTGRQKAIEAAEAIGATLLFPELCQCCTCTDHNDVMVCRRRCARG